MEEAGVSWGTIAGIGIVLYLLYVAIGGLIIGALARWLLPGPDPMSYPRTILYGLGGSLAGGIVGWLASIVMKTNGQQGIVLVDLSEQALLRGNRENL